MQIYTFKNITQKSRIYRVIRFINCKYKRLYFTLYIVVYYMRFVHFDIFEFCIYE